MKMHLFLASVLVLSSASSVWAQEAVTPAPSSSLRQEMKQDSQKIKDQKQVIRADRAKLKQDKVQYGENSTQVQADRGQMKKDIVVRKALKKDRHEKKVELKGGTPAASSPQSQ